VGVEPTRDICMPHIGFEVRAQHRPGLASDDDGSASGGGLNGGEGVRYAGGVVPF